MTDTAIQYILIALLIIGLTYLAYLLKDKGKAISEDYFGIANTILSMLSIQESTPENVKKILRAVSDSVNYVEANLKNEDNSLKEQRALALAKDAICLLNLNSDISEESIKYIIRLSSAFLPPTGKNQN